MQLYCNVIDPSVSEILKVLYYSRNDGPDKLRMEMMLLQLTRYFQILENTLVDG